MSVNEARRVSRNETTRRVHPPRPDASLFSGRYWVAVKHGRVDFGVGDVCGQRTVLSYQDADSPIEVLRFYCCRNFYFIVCVERGKRRGSGCHVSTGVVCLHLERIPLG